MHDGGGPVANAEAEGHGASAAPLSRYRVLDLTDARGLIAGHLLAQLGADVIQVEPPGGSPARREPPFDDADGTSLFWAAYAAGKRGVRVDPASPGGREALLALAAGADVLIESAGPAGMAALGLGYDAVRAINPRLVYVSISAFGGTGPKAGHAASDLTLWAAAGTLWPHRGQSGVPLRMSVPQAFHQAALDAACGALVALLARGDDGAGQHVDISAQASCMLCTLSSHLAAAVGHDDFNPLGGVQSARLLDLSGSGARTRKTKWQVRDGLVEMHIGMGAAAGRYANALFAWLRDIGEVPAEFAMLDWIEVPRLLEAGAIDGALLNRARAYVAQVLARFTKDEILAIAQARRLLMAPVMTTADLLASAQFAARGLFGAAGASARRLPMPFAAGGGGAKRLRPAPRPGEHDDEILAVPRPTVPPTPIAARRQEAPALAGIRVLDLAWVVAGPLIGRMLADFGATVVRVESRRRVDTARVMGPFPNARFDDRRSLLFENVNANKLGLALDLSHDGGRAVARDLAGWADVVIESFLPGQMAKFGLDYATLRAANPSLIMVSSSLLGQTGPNARFAGFGNVGGALSGFQQLVGERDAPPVGTFGPYTDFVGPRFALIALLAAIDRRRRTGEGCHLDMAQVEGAVALLAPQLLDQQANGRVAAPLGNRDPSFAPHGIFPAQDEDAWIAIVARDEAEWRRLAMLVGGAALAGDPRFATLAGRKANEEALEAIVARWSGGLPAGQAEALLQADGIAAHVVARSRDILADPQVAHRGQIVRMPHPLMGETLFDAARATLSATPARYVRTAPQFGRDDAHVLGTLLGYDRARIDALAAAGVLA